MDFGSVEDSPHIWQVKHHNGYISRTDIPFKRLLTEDDPQAEYRRRRDEVKTVIHWGQRKLMLAEIEFLTMFSEPGDVVVYSGAAPGTHICYLSQLFPDLIFELYDPAPFTVKDTDRIRTHQEFFTDDIAQLYSGQSVLFISDIRSSDWEISSKSENEKCIISDMDAQQRWHLIINSKVSMLKFRLPWTSGKTTYLAGDIYLPVWGAITTTETRLVCRGNRMMEYDNTKYEQQMFYFNTISRIARYAHGLSHKCLDHCYDCTSEIFILSQYILSKGTLTSYDQIIKLSDDISKSISSDRTLCSPNPDPGQRKEKIKKRQYIKGKPAYQQ